MYRKSIDCYRLDGNLICLINKSEMFFQAVAVSIRLYGGTNWTLTKRLEIKLYGNYTKMLCPILNNWKKRLTKEHLCSHYSFTITQTIQVR